MYNTKAYFGDFNICPIQSVAYAVYSEILIRQVSQDNQGKHTAGVDGQRSLTPGQKTELVIRLKFPTEKGSPTRRVWIPKPNSKEKRPLGIPTMEDRARQALAKKGMEPEWEAKFEPNSYGFRPGRSSHDAISAIFMTLSERTKYILDADIAKCFDRINHDALLDKLNTYPTLRRQIKSWLKAGVMEGKKLFSTEVGTPQGGVISPLLANIALHGLEEHINKAFPRQKGNRWNRKGTYIPDKRPAVKVVRYADDFVILHDHLEVIHQAKEITQEWLKGMGLELKPSKTVYRQPKVDRYW
jgi:RNA-directed DNA polymerase